MTIPADLEVPVPGIGMEPLWNALQAGGPSQLVQSVTQLTGVTINHYARIDFSHIAALVNAIGGVTGHGARCYREFRVPVHRRD